MPKTARLLPGYMVDRYRAWRALRFEKDRAWYARLAEGGQRPRAMVFSCCDSRVDAVGLFGAEPGDLFVVRNVANLVPPYAPDHAHHGASAALEYAVTVLKVAHIVVLGHSNCGGVEACHDMCSGAAPHLEEETSFVGRWMSILAPGYAKVSDTGSREERLRLLEQEAVQVSLRNLESFPFVKSAVDRNLLTLHGAWMDIGEGVLHVFSAETRRFAPLEIASA
ncbi:carbonic anhydrase [Rubrimonas cliftonensis]|uniref:Carbonic anhydrase n=1 Tax=Rubrimonas cliftonensis TaxID=89524 RepID=A0A1H4BRX1_9RHOB|nr:carbonic anhydrase [Rubrimonas cliftonensis]SEA50868.1 carbonic anhydrase [Rubrimonas cliftonensis]